MKALTLAAVVMFSGGAVHQPEQVFKPGPGVTNPEVVKDVKPRYTAAAMRDGIQGEVQVEAIVGVDGKPTGVKVVKSLDKVHGLDDEAVEAVSQWLFKPGTREGKPVPVQVQIALTFALREEHVYDSSEGEVTPPVLTFAKKPEYTREAIADKIEGVVELEGIVQTGGAVDNVRIVKGLDPGLDANAVAAFKGYGYKPATRAGRPVHYRVKVQILFELKK